MVHVYSTTVHDIQKIAINSTGFLSSMCDRNFSTGCLFLDLSMEYHSCTSGRENIPGELRRLLESLSPDLDDNTKRTTLHTITQCILLRESEVNVQSYKA